MCNRGLGAALLALLLLGAIPAVRAADLPPDLAGDEEARGFADLLFAQGMAAFGQRDYAAALPALERAAATWPDDPTYRYFSALCKLGLERLDEAVAELRALLPPVRSRVPESRLRATLGEALWRAGDLPGAEQELRAATGLDVRDAMAHFYLGLARLGQRDETEAFVELERAAALDPALGSTVAYYLGVAAVRRGDDEAARESFSRATAAPSPTLAHASGQWIDLLATPAARFDVPPAELRFGLIAVYDDNAGRRGDPPGAPARDDGEYMGVLRARLAVHPLQRGGLTLGLVGQGYGSRYEDFESGDLEGLQGVVQAAWGSDPAGFLDGPLGFQRVPVGTRRVGLLLQAGATVFDVNDRPFRRDQEAAASLVLHEGRLGKTQLDAQYGDVDFREAFFGPLAGQTRTGRLGQVFYFGRPQRYLRLDLARADSSAELDALDRKTDQARGELALPCGRRVTLFLYAAVTRVDWDDESAGAFQTAEAREDDESTERAVLAVILGRHAYLTFEAARAEREVAPDSLDPLFEFERSTGSAGITVHW